MYCDTVSFLYVFVGAITGSFAYKWYISRNCHKNQHVERLKNALLTYSLAIVKHDAFDDTNMQYNTFDGSKLPTLSGYSTANACFTYIQDKHEFRKSLFYSRVMEEKLTAIEKYLHAHFDSTSDVVTFFDTFIEKISNAKDDDESDISNTKSCSMKELIEEDDGEIVEADKEKDD